MKKKTIRQLGLDRNIRPPRPVDIVAKLRRMRTELLLDVEAIDRSIERIEARDGLEDQRSA